MVWIESHQSLNQHPKAKRLTRKLGIHKMQAIGHLHALWWWAVDYAEDGYLDRYEDDDIADAVEWDGDAPTFMQALVDSGFVDVEDDGRRRIHDWDQYMGRLIARREADRERKRKAAAKDSAGTPPESDGTLRESRCNKQTNQTDRPTRARARGDDAARQETKEVTDEQLVKLQEKHPSLDVHDQLERYRDWQASTGKRHKSQAAGFRNWLKTEEEKRQRYKPPTHSNGKQPAFELSSIIPDNWDCPKCTAGPTVGCEEHGKPARQPTDPRTLRPVNEQ